MKRRFLWVLAAVAFVVGVIAPSAFATSYPGTPVRIAGGAGSCTLIQASVNNETHRGGGQVSNHDGCNIANPLVNMPTGRLRVKAFIVRYLPSGGTAFCGESPYSYNPSPAHSRSTSVETDIAYGLECVQYGQYQGSAEGGRLTNSGTWAIDYADSPIRFF